jgi:hypothetical protein
MSVPLLDWLWQMSHMRIEPARGTQCDDRMLAVGIMESYLFLIQECTKEEAWRRIKILRAALNANTDDDSATPAANTQPSSRHSDRAIKSVQTPASPEA